MTGVRAGSLDQATEQKGRAGCGTLISSNPRENFRIIGTYPLPAERFSPYLGVGLNWTMFYSEGGNRNPAVLDVDVRNAFGVALNVGMDIELAPNWLMNIDVKKLFLRPDVAVDTALGRINATADLDPWIVGVGVRYRF